MEITREPEDETRSVSNTKDKYISIHFRNTDIKNDTNEYLSKIKNAFSEHKHIDTLYVATDDANFYDKVKFSFPEKNIIRSTIPLHPPPRYEGRGLHHLHPDRVKQQHNCLIDIFNILLSDVFIPSNNSSFSRVICRMIIKGYTIFPNFISKTIIM